MTFELYNVLFTTHNTTVPNILSGHTTLGIHSFIIFCVICCWSITNKYRFLANNSKSIDIWTIKCITDSKHVTVPNIWGVARPSGIHDYFTFSVMCCWSIINQYRFLSITQNLLKLELHIVYILLLLTHIMWLFRIFWGVTRPRGIHNISHSTLCGAGQ